jgi:hypothetical protein
VRTLLLHAADGHHTAPTAFGHRGHRGYRLRRSLLAPRTPAP